MRHHPLRPVALAASLTVAVALCSAAAAVARPAAMAATTAATRTQGQGRPVFLINGEQLSVGATSAYGQSVSTLGPVGAAATAGQTQTLTMDGKSYVLPDDAMPYLGRGLDPSLFDVSALAGAESGGELPVLVSYTGQLPALPGVTILSSGGGAAAGYLTAAGATKLGAALAGQFTADHARGSYGQDGIFAHGVSIALAGAVGAGGAPAPAPHPKYAMHTLTVDGTDLSGQPDTGDYVIVTNVDNSSLFSNPAEAVGVFKHGVAKFSVPAGHYWAVGQFGGGFFSVSHVVVLPQFSVTANTTVHVAEQAATSRIQMVTSRPGILRDVGFNLSRTAAAGPIMGVQWLNSLGLRSPAPPLYVSPTRVSPATGTLTAVTTGWLYSRSTAPGTPYEYDLAYQSRGTIPAQHYVVNQASVATENARFYGAVTSTGLEGRTPVFPIAPRTQNVQEGGILTITPFDVIRLPTARTIYMSVHPSLAWVESFFPSVWWAGYGGQTSAPRAFVPGQRLAEDWGAYPLHPAPDVKLIQAIGGNRPLPVSASRAGNNLSLYMTAFSDSVPGHTGGRVIFKPFTATASYEIDQNGTQIAGGPLPYFQGRFAATTTLSSAPSTIRFELDTAVRSKLQPLSSATQTVWTWRSAQEAGSTLPPGWACSAYLHSGRACAVQPMMTLRYRVVGLGLAGSASPGQQVVRVSVGHLQLAKAAKITGVTESVSFDGGKTWQAASVSGAGGSYAAVFSAPAGALVTLRTSAADAAGGSVTETITNAYQVAS